MVEMVHYLDSVVVVGQSVVERLCLEDFRENSVVLHLKQEMVVGAGSEGQRGSGDLVQPVEKLQRAFGEVQMVELLLEQVVREIEALQQVRRLRMAVELVAVMPEPVLVAQQVLGAPKESLVDVAAVEPKVGQLQVLEE